MGFFKKLIGTAAITGAAVGGALYLKKRKEERENESDFIDDTANDYENYVDFSKDESGKISITINTNKIKNTADCVADKVLDGADKAMDTVSEKIGEDNIEKIKSTSTTVMEKAKDVVEYASEKATIAKDYMVDMIGEENINSAKEAVSEFVEKTNIKFTTKNENQSNSQPNQEEDIFEDSFQEEITPNNINTEDDVFLDEELEEI